MRWLGRGLGFVLSLGGNWCSQHGAAVLSLQTKLEVGFEVVSSAGDDVLRELNHVLVKSREQLLLLVENYA